MKNISFTTFLLIGFFVFTENIFGQAKCSQKAFTDDNKRDFSNRTPFKFDVDGDGKLDTILPRTYKTKATGNQKGIREIHWITFDLKTSEGKTINSFFKFKYGDNRADYWVYVLIPCKISSGMKNDLLFYVGDDGGDETVILKNNGNSFKIHSKKEDSY